MVGFTQTIHKKIKFKNVVPTTSIMEAGTGSSDKYTSSTANLKFMRFYFENTATSGDNRGAYLRLYLSGAGGSGEALRVFTTCNDVACGTAHGAHISLSFASSGSITGLGVAGRNTIHVPDAAISNGTYAATQAEIYSDGASSDISGAAEYSFIRLVASGNSTGVATVDAGAVLFDMSGLTTASGRFVDTDKTTHSAYGGIPINTDDGTKWLAVVSD